MADTYTIFDLTTIAPGKMHIRMETNDDNDDGYPDPGPITVWEKDTSEETARQVAGGKSRVGAYGQPVDVFVDGVKI
jgi:hypothetical protein